MLIELTGQISPILGPPLMFIFICMTNILLITSLISILSNSLTKVRTLPNSAASEAEIDIIAQKAAACKGGANGWTRGADFRTLQVIQHARDEYLFV